MTRDTPPGKLYLFLILSKSGVIKVLKIPRLQNSVSAEPDAEASPLDLRDADNSVQLPPASPDGWPGISSQLPLSDTDGGGTDCTELDSREPGPAEPDTEELGPPELEPPV